MSFKRDLQQVLAGSYAWLTRLILANVLVFIVLNILVHLVFMTSKDSADAVKLAVVMPTDIRELGPRFWTIFSSMFVHFDFWHLLGNMIWLYFGGRLMSDYLNGQRLLITYLIGGLSGSVLLLLAAMVFPAVLGNGIAWGASSAAIAVVICIAAYMPDLPVRLFGVWEIRLKYIALISFLMVTVIDLSANTGGKIGHLGGAIWGFIYGTQLRRNPKFMSSISGFFRKREKKSKLRVEHRRATDDIDYNASKLAIRKRIDEILDKISRSGYDSLSKDEREFLHKNGGNI